MTNLHTCLERAIQAGEVEADRARAAQEEFDQLVARHSQVMPLHQAEATAAAQLKEATRRARRSRRHMVLNQLQSMTRIQHLVRTSKHPDRALLALLESVSYDGFSGESVRWVSDALQDRIRADLKDALSDTGQNVFGRSRDVVLFQDVVRELHLQPSGNPVAKAHADAVRKAQTWLRQMFNAHGGDIGEIADYGMRHSHNARKIRDTPFGQWAGAIFDALDWHRIIDTSTGQPFAAKGAQPARPHGMAFLQIIYNNIVSEGWNSRTPSLTTGGKALYNRHGEARLLHFKDADAWMGYNAEFGDADPFTTLIGGLDAMAREVALMRVLGPNPNAGLEFAIQTATQRAMLSGNGKLIARVASHAKRARVLLHHVNGAINQPDHEGWARFFSNMRFFNVSAKLGSAILSSVTDTATITMGAMAMKMNPANMLATSVKMMAGNATRDTAARMGFVAETLSSIGTASSRLTNDVVASDVFSRLSGFTIRASGLSFWTDRLRLSVQMETAGHMADQADRALGNIEAPSRALLERNGITASDWDALRDPSGLFTAPNGGTFIAPFWWLEHQTVLPRHEAEALAIRYQAAIRDQLETFMPTKRLRASAWVLRDTKPGSFLGELGRSTIGFKNYSLSLTLGQIAQYHAIPTPQGRFPYAVGMIASMTVLGGVVIQLRELDKGRDPIPMTDAKFWVAALAQGGGLGIFGDFLFSEKNRFGGGIEKTLAGPQVGVIGDVLNAGVSNAVRAVQGEKTYLGRDISNLIRYNTPVASSLWYTRKAFDAAIADQLQMLLDPDAQANMRRQERKRDKAFGNTSWWNRGDLLPSKAPDLRNALNGRE